jgi:hypothetical protein
MASINLNLYRTKIFILTVAYTLYKKMCHATNHRANDPANPFAPPPPSFPKLAQTLYLSGTT